MTDGTFVLRHASTAYSRQYRVNGDPSVNVGLDDLGRAHCREVRDSAGWLAEIRSCAVSEFRRTAQTAALLRGTAVVDRIEPRLNEIGYGSFEGGPWTEYGSWLNANGRHARPADAVESLHEAHFRLLTGLLTCLTLPAPRLIVSHGMLIALLRRLRSHGDVGPLALPGENHLAVLAFTDADLAAVVNGGLAVLRGMGAAVPQG